MSSLRNKTAPYSGGTSLETSVPFVRRQPTLGSAEALQLTDALVDVPCGFNQGHPDNIACNTYTHLCPKKLKKLCG